MLSGNSNAIHLLERNKHQIDWSMLSRNSKALHLLAQNPSKVDWLHLSSNPSIFEYDYIAMKNYRYDSGLIKEMMEKIFHPKNIEKFAGYQLGMGYDEDNNLDYL